MSNLRTHVHLLLVISSEQHTLYVCQVGLNSQVRFAVVANLRLVWEAKVSEVIRYCVNIQNWFVSANDHEFFSKLNKFERFTAVSVTQSTIAFQCDIRLPLLFRTPNKVRSCTFIENCPCTLRSVYNTINYLLHRRHPIMYICMGAT